MAKNIDRYQLHRELSEIFPNSKEYLIKVFMEEIKPSCVKDKVRKIKGTKILVRFRDDKDVFSYIEKTGLDPVVFYNAFLECLIEKYGDIKSIIKEIEKWRENSILRFV